MNDTQTAEVGSEDYNQQMADKFQNQTVDQEQIDELPVQPMPEGGYEKFYNSTTGEYSWENHAKELAYRLQQKDQPEQQLDNGEQANNQEATEQLPEGVNDIISQAGLNGNDLRSQLEETGELSEDAISALERVGLPRDIVNAYVENLNYRMDAQYNEALNYVGGEEAWAQMEQWGQENLSEAEINQYNSLLGTSEWRIAADALKVRMGDAAPSTSSEPSLMSGQQQAGSTFGYRSKAEMKSDMSDPRYQSDPAYRQEVARKMQSATWDLD